MPVDLYGPASASGAVTVRPSDTRTFGTVDSWFKDCSDPLTDDGTAYEAAFFNALLANIRSIARGNGNTGGGAAVVAEDNSANDALWRACQHMYQRAQPAWAVDSSVAANQLVVSLTPTAAELKSGMRVRVKVANDNTGATTMTVNALNATCKTVAGQDLQEGMLIAGQIAEFVFDGTYWQFVSVHSEKVTFTPRATINTAAIGSVPRNAWTTHNLSLGSQSNVVTTVGASSLQLPAGTYLAVSYGALAVNAVVNATQMAHQQRLVKNGAQVGIDHEVSYLTAGQDLTTFRSFAAVVNVVASDVLQVQSWVGTTSAGDFSGASAGAGTIDLIRIGN